MKIFIDHYGAGADRKFTDILRKRLVSIDGVESIATYSDVDDSDGDAWEPATVKAIAAADIVVAVVSPNYIQYVSENVEKEFEKIIDSPDRFLFPVLLRKTEWSDRRWVVRSKVIPASGIPISDHDPEFKKEITGTIASSIIAILNTRKSQKEEVSPHPGALFISHSHADADFAELLKLKLDKEGISSWIDSERLKVGQDWREEIDRGIEESGGLIAVMSPEARASEYVTYEWAFAWGKGKRVFPIMLHQTPLHPRLESLQYLDFTNRATRPWDTLFSSISGNKPAA